MSATYQFRDQATYDHGGHCVYCGSIVTDETIVPKPSDDAAWAELAQEHAQGCEWIGTRAHWRTSTNL